MAEYGYAGRILYVDLTTGSIDTAPLDPDISRRFIGGWGVNAWLYHRLVPPGIDPLSAENALIVGTGPFTGTFIPASARTYVTHKHPLSGTVGAATCTGVFSYMLKSAGFDHAVITGRSPKPVYLKIAQKGVELCDAGRLWGLDTYETVFALRREHEPCGVLAIGPAGERRVCISVTHSDTGQGAIGQGGMVAVMGAKNLKAVVALQGETPIRVADAKRLTKAVDRVLEQVRTYPRLEGLRAGGGWYMMRGGMMGGGAGGEEAVRREAEAFEAHRKSRSNIACPNCPVACRERIRLTEGRFAGLLSYNTMTTGGGLNVAGIRMNYNQMVKYQDLMNRYGVDLMFFNNMVSLLLNLSECDALLPASLLGTKLKRDYDTLLELARQVAFREGIGDVMAEGVLALCRHFGLDPERDVQHVKGWNRIIDARLTGANTLMMSQLTEPRGPTGFAGTTHPPAYQPGQPPDRWLKYAREQGLPPEAEARVFTANGFNPGRLLKWMHAYWSTLQSLGFCGRLYITRFHDLAVMADYLAALTGEELSPEALLAKGERNWTLNKILNVREGFSRKDDRPPAQWFEPLELPGLKKELTLMDYYRTRRLGPEDVAGLLDDYYDECGWDPKTTAPRPETLKRLGLEDIAF